MTQLNALLSQKKESIMGRWLALIFGTYPEDFARFMSNQKDRFNNPVGYTIVNNAAPIYDAVCKNESPETVAASLEGIIKVRSVQDFSPSEALSFVVLLKQAVREELADDLDSVSIHRELMMFEDIVDRFTGFALDMYSRIRERIFEIKVNEIKARSYKLLERANLLDKLE